MAFDLSNKSSGDLLFDKFQFPNFLEQKFEMGWKRNFL